MWSRYLRTKEKNGVVAIFHELHPYPMYCSVKQWRQILNGGSAEETFQNALKFQKLIIKDEAEDQMEFEATVATIERKLNQATILYLMTAQGCNFACKYCPVPEIAQKYGASVLSSADAFAGIDLWIEHLKDTYDPSLEYTVIFYGGEPLLNKEVIKDSLIYIRAKSKEGELPEHLSLMIATNGALVDDEIIALSKEYQIGIAVGLDGTREINDALKVDTNGIGTYDRVVETIRKLVQNGIRTFVSASITPENIELLPGYSEFFEELGVEKFGFNFLKGQKLVDLVGANGLEEYYRKASRGIIENSRKHHKPGFEYQIEKKQLAFDRMDYFPVDCTCLGNQLVIQPDGQISNCPFFKSYLGQVQKVGKDFRIWNQPIVKEWRKRSSVFHEGVAKAICGAGCAWSSAEIKGSYLAVDDSSKIFSEEVLDELIWSRYEQQA